MMQYNVYFIEILGEENLKGVSIPVIVDNRQELDDEKMADIARVLNTYRTVFVRPGDSDSLKTRVFSVKGETRDCLYASVAALYSLTEENYIREMEAGEKDIILENNTCKNKVHINYGNMMPASVIHEINLFNMESQSIKEEKNYIEENLAYNNGENNIAKIYFTVNSVTFSSLRKKIIELDSGDSEYMIIYYDKDMEMAFFHVERSSIAAANKLDSRTQISLLVSYLLKKEIEREKISGLCHVLNTGQYAILEAFIKEDKMFIKMNARTLVEGILNL